MIKSLELRNFRNFNEKIVNFTTNKNLIIWENWHWKTNILEAISLFSDNSLLDIDYKDLVNNQSDVLFIRIISDNKNEISISYDKKINKKKFFINKKAKSKKVIKDFFPKIVSFHPMIMNMMYLSPSLRRNFLDNILINSFEEYSKILKDYKKIVISRNKTLKNINEAKSKKEEILFWNNSFIEKAEQIYKYREKIILFIESNINEISSFLDNKIDSIRFEYKTKIDRNNVTDSLKSYIKKNIDRDIILWKTYIWPHLDDFDIILDNSSLINFASRWEVKSIVLWLKLLEARFLETINKKSPIFLIDDLLSELDWIHLDYLMKNINKNQTIITSINNIDIWQDNIILL